MSNVSALYAARSAALRSSSFGTESAYSTTLAALVAAAAPKALGAAGADDPKPGCPNADVLADAVCADCPNAEGAAGAPNGLVEPKAEACAAGVVPNALVVGWAEVEPKATLSVSNT